MTTRAKMLFLAAIAALGTAFSAHADDYAYLATGSGGKSFGVIDLTTGVFTQCGVMQVELSGLGVGPDHALYGGGYKSGTFYRIDLTNGNLTAVGTSGVDFALTGSTTNGLYAVGFDNKLYAMSTAGAATLVGPTGVTIGHDGWWSLSTNSKTLYYTAGVPMGTLSTLYKLSLNSGKAKAIATVSAGEFGASVMILGTLYGGSESPLAVYAVDPSDGNSTFVANLTPSGLGNFWGLAPIRATSIKTKNMCAVHKI